MDQSYNHHVSLGDLLNNYCWNDDLMNVIRLLFCVTVLFTYPLECFVCREVVENAISPRGANSEMNLHQTVTNSLEKEKNLFAINSD